MNSRILIVEPSLFRREDTYILGPYGRIRAFFVALRTVIRYPESEVRVVSAKATVMIGDQVLYRKNNNSV